jgi:outer membrane protein TolC
MWPVFDGGRTKAAVAQAEASRRALEARAKELDDLVALKIRQRLAEVESSQAAIDAAESAIRAATEARRVVEDRFAAGVATNTDVLDAQGALLQASLDRTEALANARLAEARLHHALGQ